MLSALTALVAVALIATLVGTRRDASADLDRIEWPASAAPWGAGLRRSRVQRAPALQCAFPRPLLRRQARPASLSRSTQSAA